MWGVVLAGGAATAATIANAGDSELGADPWSLVRGVAVATYLAVGLYTWGRRPSALLGPRLVQIALIFAVTALAASNQSLPHTVGRIANVLLVVLLARVFIYFPRDRAGSAVEARVVGLLALSTGVVWLLALPVVERLPSGGPLIACEGACPPNSFRLVSAPEPVTGALNLVVSVVTAAALLVVVVVLLGKARSPARLRQRLIVPLLLSMGVLALTYASFALLRDAHVSAADVLRPIGAAAAIAVPVAILVGQIRGRVFAASGVAEFVTGLRGSPATPPAVEDTLRRALGDPSLTLALQGSGGAGWVGVDGHELDLRQARRDRAVTRVHRDGREVAAVVHDPGLEEGSVTEGLAATALVLLENARLVDELKESRTRIVETAQHERLRLERNLHDGAQQRLVAVLAALGGAQARAGDAGLAGSLDAIADEAQAALEELRELAHGLYPTVLRERGLVDGIRALSHSGHLAVDVVAEGVPRSSPTVEEAAYFFVREALQNVAKHAGPAAHVTVTLERDGTDLQVTVVDDGPGFDVDAVGAGIGLASMRDRIGAVGGEVWISSAPGSGTTVRALVPGCFVPQGEE